VVRRKRVLVHLKDGGATPSIEGALVSRRPEFVLVDAVAWESPDRSHELDGRVRIPRANIRYYQDKI
jgi:hypothetical protein